MSLFYAGARVSEPTNLRVRDFTYDAEFPILHLTIKGGKTNMVAIILEYAAAIRAYLDVAPHRDDADAYLFQACINGKPGHPMDRSTLAHLFQWYAEKAAGHVRAFPHMSRATMNTAAYEAGATGEDIQRTVGHSSITTNRRV
ncbi:site-specific integrase [uncultured Tateyamaria sp.]|uniref:tyrosine-type recombinase/integrase n=1 Tax=uncultured Tateyamaria sp. TaxID=455651 RepID=UPI002624F88D|nr:site-specific integrase [uncultured Tateyamaria sp.]